MEVTPSRASLLEVARVARRLENLRVLRGAAPMTYEEDAALGRLVSRYSAAKQRRIALIAEALRLGGLLEDVGHSLRASEMTRVAAFSDGKVGNRGYDRDDLTVASLPTLADVTALVDELRTVSADVRELRDQLKEAGLSVE